MKRVKIKKIIPKTLFKAILFAGAIPYFLFLLFSLTSVLVGLSQNGSILNILYTIYFLLFFPLISGVMALVISISYNWLAQKFGGLEIEIEDSIENNH